jgi:hypothetical protein
MGLMAGGNFNLSLAVCLQWAAYNACNSTLPDKNQQYQCKENVLPFAQLHRRFT